LGEEQLVEIALKRAAFERIKVSRIEKKID
jgi:hypothetical protein